MDSILLPDSFEHENDVIRQLVFDLDLHDPGESAHSERVAVFSTATGHELGISSHELRILRYAATLHDIGKMKVNRAVLRKLGTLTEEDFFELRSHVGASGDLLKTHDFLVEALPAIRHHHERFDGTGYPNGLRAEEIPLGARIICICEAFDVLLFGCPWRNAVTEFEALFELDRCSGTQFDPQVVDAFKSIQPLIQPVRSSSLE